MKAFFALGLLAIAVACQAQSVLFGFSDKNKFSFVSTPVKELSYKSWNIDLSLLGGTSLANSAKAAGIGLIASHKLYGPVYLYLGGAGISVTSQGPSRWGSGWGEFEVLS